MTRKKSDKAKAAVILFVLLALTLLTGCRQLRSNDCSRFSRCHRYQQESAPDAGGQGEHGDTEKP